MLIPHLKQTYDRLFDTYSFEQKAKIVKGFLFEHKGHCQLDTDVLGLDGQKTHGWKSGNILRHLGLTKEFKNIFSGYSVDEAIQILKAAQNDDFSDIIALLQYSQEISS